jgi:hypothetical protein
MTADRGFGIDAFTSITHKLKVGLIDAAHVPEVATTGMLHERDV